jgi:hypothetical protein
VTIKSQGGDSNVAVPCADKDASEIMMGQALLPGKIVLVRNLILRISG